LLPPATDIIPDATEVQPDATRYPQSTVIVEEGQSHPATIPHQSTVPPASTSIAPASTIPPETTVIPEGVTADESGNYPADQIPSTRHPRSTVLPPVIEEPSVVTREPEQQTQVPEGQEDTEEDGPSIGLLVVSILLMVILCALFAYGLYRESIARDAAVRKKEELQKRQDSRWDRDKPEARQDKPQLKQEAQEPEREKSGSSIPSEAMMID
jgi:hypothetical protein